MVGGSLIASSICLLFDDETLLSDIYNAIAFHFYAFFARNFITHPVAELIAQRDDLLAYVSSSLYRDIRIGLSHSSVMRNYFEPSCRLTFLRYC